MSWNKKTTERHCLFFREVFAACIRFASGAEYTIKAENVVVLGEERSEADWFERRSGREDLSEERSGGAIFGEFDKDGNGEGIVLDC